MHLSIVLFVTVKNSLIVTSIMPSSTRDHPSVMVVRTHA